MIDTTQKPPLVHHLHYEFDGWLGDSLLETFPCLIATEGLASDLRGIAATGVRFLEVEATISEELALRRPDLTLPKFVRLEVFGREGRDDLSLSDDHRLVVSERVLALLRKHGIENAIVAPR